jgi:hypothetical protein
MSGQYHTNIGEPNSKMSEVFEETVDTDADSWDSGSNQPDYFDRSRYDENDPTDDNSLEDEGDEDNLGNMSDEEYRRENDGIDLGMSGKPRVFAELDDLNYKDRTFDCD